jgi:hypothetical protein
MGLYESGARAFALTTLALRFVEGTIDLLRCFSPSQGFWVDVRVVDFGGSRRPESGVGHQPVGAISPHSSRSTMSSRSSWSTSDTSSALRALVARRDL